MDRVEKSVDSDALFRIFQDLVQQVPGPEQLGLHGSQRQVELGGDLFVGEFLEIPQSRPAAGNGVSAVPRPHA